MPARHRLAVLLLPAAALLVGLSGCTADVDTSTNRPVTPQLDLLSDPTTVTQFSGIGSDVSATVAAGDLSRTLGEQAEGSGTLTITVSCSGSDTATVLLDEDTIGSGSCAGESSDASSATGFSVNTPKDSVDLTVDHELSVTFTEDATATVTVQLVNDEPTAPRTQSGFDAAADGSGDESNDDETGDDGTSDDGTSDDGTAAGGTD